MAEPNGDSKQFTLVVKCLTFLVFLVTTTALAKSLLKDVPLMWRPTTQVGSEKHTGGVVTYSNGAAETGTSGVLAVRIRIEKLGDVRENRQLIGENREDVDEGKILPVTTRDDVASWCTDRLRRLLEQYGFAIVEEGEDVVLGGQVRSFFVAETNTYEGDVSLRIEVRSNTGKALWSGLASGVAGRFGRSYKLENYYEVLSDSLLDAVRRLADSEEFRRAINESKTRAVAKEF